MSTLVYAVEKPNIPPFEMPDRFRHEIAYFMSVTSEPGDAPLAEGEYRVRPAEVVRWLDDGVFRVVSPLDSASQTEVELSEEQEAWLLWMLAHEIDRVRLG